MRTRPPSTTHELAVIALDFRRAIEKSRLRRHAKIMARFPVGCCKHSSQLLARYLVTDLHVPLVTFVHGERGGGPNGDPWQSHVWLRVGQHTVDITADQYNEVDVPVVVSVGSGWHSMWQKQRQLTYGEMMHLDFWERLRFRRMYNAVLKGMQRDREPRVFYPLRNGGPPGEPA
ncbi:MAG TPA: hypothetical protein VGK20_03850 [Candidatus Binatia bacterium]|jgi:hypothetical protein